MLLKPQVKEVVVEKNPNNLISVLKKTKFDVVILDMNYNSVVNTGNEGIYWLTKIKEIDKDIAVFLIPNRTVFSVAAFVSIISKPETLPTTPFLETPSVKNTAAFLTTGLFISSIRFVGWIAINRFVFVDQLFKDCLASFGF